MSELIQLTANIPTELSGQRLDRALSALFPQYSRSQHQNWIKSDAVSVNKQIINKTRQTVHEGEHIEVQGSLLQQQENWQAQDLPLDIVHEDEALMIINKPAGLTVHPGAGQADSTLVNALKFHCPALTYLPRAGLIHRLDKNTSGLLVVAKTQASYRYLVAALEERNIKRQYLALVQGQPISGGEIDAAIGRHRTHRIKMAITKDGREAKTFYRIKQRLRLHTLLEMTLESGRTHQIRVHLEHIHHPIVGDPLYGRRYQPSQQLTQAARAALQGFKRQALHACRLSLQHPGDGEIKTWEAPLPKDFADLMKALEKDHQQCTNHQ